MNNQFDGLRPYQETALDQVHDQLKSYNRALVVMATGSGKTILFAKLAEDCLNRRGSFCNATGNVLVLVNREELLQQAIDKIHAVTGIVPGIERADDSASLDSQIVVASVDSLRKAKRLGRYPNDWASLVIVDEAHLFATPNRIEVLNYFCSPERAKLIGFTATPQTKGKRNLAKVYEVIAFEKTIASLIEEKYLCNIKVRTVPIKIDISQVRCAGGDYMDEDLEVAIVPYFEEIAKEMLNHKGRQWLAFLPLRHTSRIFAGVLNSMGIPAQHVDGESKDRKEVLLRFKNREFAAMCNSLLVTTGYDEPNITGIVNLRPTRSPIMLTQILGRGTRLKPSDSVHDDLLVLDPLWQTPDLESLISPSILFATKDEDEEELAKRLRSGDEMDLAETHALVVRDRHKALAQRLKANEKRQSKLIDFAAILALGLEKNRFWDELADYDPQAPTMRWESEPVTEGQMNGLIRFGFDVREIKNRGHASKVMSFCVDRAKRGLATFKQVRALQRAGRHVDPNTLLVGEAHRMLDQLYGGSARKYGSRR